MKMKLYYVVKEAKGYEDTHDYDYPEGLHRNLYHKVR